MKQKQSTIHPILGNLAEDRMSMQRVKSQPSRNYYANKYKSI